MFSTVSPVFATLATGIRIPRTYAVILDVAVTTGNSVFHSRADGSTGRLLPSLLSVPLAAWTGIFLADMIGPDCIRWGLACGFIPGRIIGTKAAMCRFVSWIVSFAFSSPLRHCAGFFQGGVCSGPLV